MMFVAITTLHLAFVTFTMHIYSTDAAIWNETQTTTDWQDHSGSTAYQQMETTETPQIFTKLSSTVHNKLNVSLENLTAAFNTSSNVGNCSDLQEQTDADEFYYISYEGEFPDELVRTMWEMYAEFNKLIKTALLVICTENTTVGHNVITMSGMYVRKLTEFMFRLNGSTAAIGEVDVLYIVADLYRTSIQHVQSVMELVEPLFEVMPEEKKINAMIPNMSQEIEALNSFNEYSSWLNILGKFKEAISVIQNISERAGNMSEHTDEKLFINVITSGRIWRFLNFQYWTKLLEQESQVLVKYQTKLNQVQHTHFVMYKVTPVIMAIVLVVGITGNGLLLTVFVRHKETRTLQNSMLINLTVVDFVSLVVNGYLEYLRATTPWQFGWFGCQLFIFFSYLLVAVSTYSVAIISIQRFVAINQLSSLAWCHQSQKNKYVLIATVWGIGCIVSVPHALISRITNEICKDFSLDDSAPVYTADLLTFCVLPLLITAAFSVGTAYRIRKSAVRFPVEETGQKQFRHNRMVSSTVLFALTGLFVVSYAPFFLLNFLVFVVDINVTKWEIILVNAIAYYLRFVNCCLNPIVLFVMSKRYRRYIKSYCVQREVKPATSRGSSKETSLQV